MKSHPERERGVWRRGRINAAVLGPPAHPDSSLPFGMTGLFRGSLVPHTAVAAVGVDRSRGRAHFARNRDRKRMETRGGLGNARRYDLLIANARLHDHFAAADPDVSGVDVERDRGDRRGRRVEAAEDQTIVLVVEIEIAIV